MPHLPASNLVDGELNLPDASSKSFWLHGSAWQFPDFENADAFVDRLVRDDLLVRDPVVEAALRGEPVAPSLRTVRRHFQRPVGLTPMHRAPNRTCPVCNGPLARRRITPRCRFRSGLFRPTPSDQIIKIFYRTDTDSDQGQEQT